FYFLCRSINRLKNRGFFEVGRGIGVGCPVDSSVGEGVSEEVGGVPCSIMCSAMRRLSTWARSASNRALSLSTCARSRARSYVSCPLSVTTARFLASDRFGQPIPL